MLTVPGTRDWKARNRAGPGRLSCRTHPKGGRPVNRFVPFLVATAAVLSCPAPAAASNAQKFAPLAALVHETNAATGHPTGIAIAVVHDGAIVYQGYFGLADIARGTPVGARTDFYIASATKPFTALDVLLKAQQGRARLAMPMQAMFPRLRFEGIDARAVTLQDLLTHTAGIDNGPLVWATAFSGLHDPDTLRALVARSGADPDAPHGTFKYTNVGYNIASVWLDERFGRPWQEQLQQDVFGPLGMGRTSAYISEAEAKGWTMALPYSLASDDPGHALYLTKSDDTMQAAGGMVSTAPDLAKFLIAQLDPPAGDHPQLARAITQSHATQASLDARYLDFARTGYAMGWYTGDYKGHRMLHHFGGFAGFHAHLSFMPDERAGLVVLCNEDMLCPRVASLVADYVYGEVLDQKGNEAAVAKRFATLAGQAADLRRQVRKQRAAIRARPWHLTLPREAYAGTYTNGLLGAMRIDVDSHGAIAVRWGRLHAIATGYPKDDQVRVELVPNSGNVLAFRVDRGKVVAVRLEDMVFVRQAATATP